MWISNYRYYILNIRFSDVNNVRMFRILSMWLKNRNNAYILNEMRKNIPHIPTYKFIPILPQLTPHLNGSEDEEFALQIAHILGR